MVLTFENVNPPYQRATELQKVTSADGDCAPLLIHAPGFEIASITATTNFPGVRNAVVVTPDIECRSS
jgi:hypothetical protein